MKSTDSRYERALEQQKLLQESVHLIDRLMGPVGYERTNLTVGEFQVYRGNGFDVSYAATLGEGGLVVFCGQRRGDEADPYELSPGIVPQMIPELVEALNRTLVLEKLAEI